MLPPFVKFVPGLSDERMSCSPAMPSIEPTGRKYQSNMKGPLLDVLQTKTTVVPGRTPLNPIGTKSKKSPGVFDRLNRFNVPSTNNALPFRGGVA